MGSHLSVRLTDQAEQALDRWRSGLSRSDAVRELLAGLAPPGDDGSSSFVAGIRAALAMRAPNATVPASSARRITRTLTTSAAGSSKLLDAENKLAASHAPRDGMGLIQRLGIDVMPVSHGVSRVPDVTAGVSVAWKDETGSFNTTVAADPTIGEIDVGRPLTVRGQTEFSRDLLIGSAGLVGMVLEREYARALGEALATMALVGAGASTTVADQPTGLLNVTGLPLYVRTGADNGAAMTFEHALGMVEEVTTGTGKVDRDELRWAITPGLGRKLATTQKVAVGDSMVYDGMTIAGIPATETRLLPSDGAKGTGSDLHTAVLGRWSDLHVLTFDAPSPGTEGGNVEGGPGMFRMMVNPYSGDDVDKIRLTAIVDTALWVEHAAAGFVALTDVVV